MLQVAREPRFPIVQWRLFETRHIIRDAGVKSALSRMGTVHSGLKTYCTSSRGLFVPCIKENRAVEVAIVQRNVGTSPGCDLLEDRRVHNCSLMSIASNRPHLTSEGKSPSNSGCCSRLRLSRIDMENHTHGDFYRELYRQASLFSSTVKILQCWQSRHRLGLITLGAFVTQGGVWSMWNMCCPTVPDQRLESMRQADSMS
jgi:hypothetical protein